MKYRCFSFIQNLGTFKQNTYIVLIDKEVSEININISIAEFLSEYFNFVNYIDNDTDTYMCISNFMM